MITLFDMGPPSTVFLTFYLATLAIVSYQYYTEPVNPYCIRKNQPSDCGEDRRNYIPTVLMLSLTALIWTWILNIAYGSGLVALSWFLVFIPCLVSLIWAASDFIPKDLVSGVMPPSYKPEKNTENIVWDAHFNNIQY